MGVDRIGAHKTTIQIGEEGEIMIVYDGVSIVSLFPHRIVLNSKGNPSSVIVRRMNQTAAQFDLPYKVLSHGVQRLVEVKSGSERSTLEEFRDGMEVER